MTRSMEHIVATHEIAAQRRALGRPVWDACGSRRGRRTATPWRATDPRLHTDAPWKEERTMPRKIIPDHRVRQMLRAGHTHKEIVEALAREDFITVTPQAISAWARRNGIETTSRSRTGYPWRIAPEHRQMLPVRAIQWWNRQEAGEKLPAQAQRRLNAALERLDAAGTVFHYDPDTIEGWWTMKRRPGDHRMYRDITLDPPEAKA